jgi:hypothetical protein
VRKVFWLHINGINADAPLGGVFALGIRQLKHMNLAAGSRSSVRQALCLLKHFDRLFDREQDSSLG